MFQPILRKFIEKECIRSFHSKLTDSDAENSETQVWLEFSFKCNYINEVIYNELLNESNEFGKLINYMILNPQKFGETGL